ncbi:MAG: enoyl-CoA hydratase [Myxococcota bacterium]|nr:enoyl-CoA hydratase [Myxococcota bacterium]
MAELDTGTPELLGRIDGRVAVLTLNRPEARNALSDTLTPALRRAVARLADDPGVGCVVLTGAEGAFCAGGDVKGMGGSGGARRSVRFEDAVEDLRERQITLTAAIYEMPQPTIAALPGPAAGAGLSIALACDLRLAARSAFVTTGFANIGMSGDYGASFFLTQLVGSAKARELFFTADRVPAAECERLGIVNRVVPDEALMDETLALAERLAAGPPIAYRYMKENLDRALRADLRTCLAHEAENLVRTALTEDHREAVRAFVEKRRPRFQGR